MNAENLIRKKYRFYGIVQGVNFRSTTISISRNFKVTGYVKNMEDGSVELLAIGEVEEVEKFIEVIKNHFKQNIVNCVSEEVKYSDSYTKFIIER